MKVKRIIGVVMCPAAFIGVLIVLMTGVSGCASMVEPLREEHLQDEAKDPRVSIVLLRFNTQRLPSGQKSYSKSWGGQALNWIFAVANEVTGWNLRRLDEFTMIFRTNYDSMEPDFGNSETGWVTFLAQPGLNYIAVTTYATAFGHAQTGWGDQGGLDLVATPFPDHISVVHSASRTTSKRGEKLATRDFLDMPRFAVQISEPRTLIYAGTIVRNIKCNGYWPASTCSYDLTVVDESEIAKTFVMRYLKDYPTASPMQTQLLTIPQSRTIEIRGVQTGSSRSRK